MTFLWLLRLGRDHCCLPRLRMWPFYYLLEQMVTLGTWGCSDLSYDSWMPPVLGCDRCVCSLNLSCDLYEVFIQSYDSCGLLGLWLDLAGLLRSQLWLVLIFLNWFWSCWCLTVFGTGYHCWGFHIWQPSHIDCYYMCLTLFLTFSLSRYGNFFIVDLILLVTRFDPKSI